MLKQMKQSLNNYGKSKLLGDLACQNIIHLQLLLEQVGYILVLVSC